jgi:hypothetical protein
LLSGSGMAGFAMARAGIVRTPTNGLPAFADHGGAPRLRQPRKGRNNLDA